MPPRPSRHTAITPPAPSVTEVGSLLVVASDSIANPLAGQPATRLPLVSRCCTYTSACVEGRLLRQTMKAPPEASPTTVGLDCTALKTQTGLPFTVQAAWAGDAD